MSPISLFLTVSLVALPMMAAAQTGSSPTSPSDPVTRLLMRRAVPAPVATLAEGKKAREQGKGEVEQAPLTREAALQHFDVAIGMAKAFRGAESTGSIQGLIPGSSRGLELGLRADRVDAAVADRPNEWTAALLSARSRIAVFVQAAPTGAEPAGIVVPAAWTPLGEKAAVDTWVKALSEAYTALGKYLPSRIPEAKATESEEEDASTFAAMFLPFAALSGGNTTPQASTQLADLYFTNRWRLYMRSTFQPKKAKTDKEKDAAAEGSAEEVTAEQAAKKVDDKVRNAMLDPSGGDLNLTAGYYVKLPTRFLEGDANDAHHGLFFDTRAGLKLIELPEQALTLNEGESTITPFYTASVGLRLRLPTYFDRLVQKRAGATELAAVFATTGIVDRNASALFSGAGATAPLPRNVQVLHVSLGVDITKVVQLGLSGNVWSNTGLTKRLVAEFRVAPSKD